MKTTKLIGVLLLCLSACGQAEETVSNDSITLIPLPNFYELKPGVFTLDKEVSITFDAADTAMTELVAYLNEQIAATGLSLTTQSKAKNIVLNLIDQAELGNEGYQLTISEKELTLSGYRHHGLFNGIQSLLQLFPTEIKSKVKVEEREWNVSCIEIVDKPQFQWRGLMLDVSRHFFTKEEVKRFIDQMAEYKYNVFHWHLTDDQGWRIAIPSLKRLTEVGAWRAPRVGNWWEREPQSESETTPYGGYYTREDIQEVVEYASERYITIVPEIDIPGHSMAFLSAYPEVSCTGGNFRVNVGNTFYTKEENTLCIGNEQTFNYLDTIFSEVAALFPSPYIHIGGDECYKGFWERCPKCQKRMHSKQLKDSKELQSYFIKRVSDIVASKGKQIIGWDEILEGGIAPKAVVMSWRGVDGGVQAARQGHQVIMTPTNHCYLDFYQGDPSIEPNTYSMLRLQDCYKFQPIPEGVNPALVLGGQGNLWTESVPHYRQVEYMIWPRALALSEALWTNSDTRNWDFFVQRVENHFLRLNENGVNYARSIYDPIIRPFLDAENKLQIEMKTEMDGLDLFYTFDNTLPDLYSNSYTEILSIPKNASMLRVISYKEAKPIGKLIDIQIDKLKKRAEEKK